MPEYMGLNIDLDRDSLFDELGLIRLRESYMRPEEVSPQHRYAYVANSFGTNKEHAQRLYEYASKHWLSLSTPILAYGRSARGLPISCFTGDTWVSIKSCGAKQIKDVGIGDQVLTHEGRWKKVLNTKKSLSNDLYELRILGRTTKIKVTGNHPILTNKGWVAVSKLNREHLVATNSYYEDVEIPYIISNTNSYYQTQQTNNKSRYVATEINNNIEVDDDLIWALGLWFAEGSTTSNGTLSVTMSATELEYVTKWKKIICEKFGINDTNNQKISFAKNNKWLGSSVFSKKLTSWFDGEFGKGCKEKHIPQWILELPKPLLATFWNACYLGDGYKTTKRTKICMANPKLATQLYHILLKLGQPNLSLSIQTKQLDWLKRENKTTITSELGIYDKSEYYNKYTNKINIGVEFGKLIFRPIQSLIKLNIGEQEVYDIMVEDDASFTVSGIIVHNCFLPWIPDSREGLVNTLSETNWLSMLGGGVGIGFGIRSSDDKSTGVITHLKTYDACSLAYKQGNTRRGSYAVYLDISHPDINMFVDIRKPTGDPNLRCANLHHGINISDAFMDIIEKCMSDPKADDSWQLIDPHTNKVTETVSAKELWMKIVETRMLTGEPYIHWIDTSNRMLPKYLKALGLTIKQSNLCTEVIEPTDAQRTAVCCLSSLNIETYEEWKDDPLFIHDVCEMLDNVLDTFINRAPDAIHRARYSAMRERDIGIGALGFHAFLQSKNVPFESAIAKSYNKKIFRHIEKEIFAANLKLGTERGEAPDAVGTGQRFCLTRAIAPNASSSIIVGNTSPSVEPFAANAYRQDTISGAYFHKNKYLDRLIKEIGTYREDIRQSYDEIWSSIITNNGSVQHLQFLNQQTRDVFKTAMEIDQRWIIEHAADRQEHIDQAQSINLFFAPDSDIKYIHLVHFLAWKKGLKSLYYCRSTKIGKADNVSQQIKRERIEEIDLSDEESYASCLPCE